MALAGLFALATIVALVIFAVGGRAPATDAPGGPAGARADDARKALESRKAVLEEASRDVLKPPPSSEPPSQGIAAPATESAPASAAPAAEAPRSDATSAAEPAIRTDAARPEPPRASPRSEPPRSASRVAAPPAPAAKAPPKAARSPPAPAPAAAVAPAAPVPNAERWVQMNDEMSRCSNDSVIPRIQCERRIRARYCEGWWGTVPECPASRPGGGN